ncbi:MAG: hypothetical protein CMJ75_03570 [Planctomycetaceae bacterium]|nr:hypothetical protein [Planctomycetaceae bacterium]
MVDVADKAILLLWNSAGNSISLVHWKLNFTVPTVGAVWLGECCFGPASGVLPARQIGRRRLFLSPLFLTGSRRRLISVLDNGDDSQT